MVIERQTSDEALIFHKTQDMSIFDYDPLVRTRWEIDHLHNGFSIKLKPCLLMVERVSPASLVEGTMTGRRCLNC